MGKRYRSEIMGTEGGAVVVSRSLTVERQPRATGATERGVSPRAGANGVASGSSPTAAGAEGGASSAAPAGFVREGKGIPYWTPERVEEVRRLVAEGRTDAQIGARFGGRSSGAIAAMRKAYGIASTRKPGSRATQNESQWTEPVRALHGKGLAPVQIAARLGISVDTVRRCLKALGLWVMGKSGPKAKPEKAKRAKPKAPPKERAPRPAKVEKPVVVDTRPHMLPRKAVVVDLPRVDGAGLLLADLPAGACRWPTAQDAHGRHLFCGAGALDGRPYCAAHQARAVAPRAPAEDAA